MSCVASSRRRRKAPEPKKYVVDDDDEPSDKVIKLTEPDSVKQTAIEESTCMDQEVRSEAKLNDKWADWNVTLPEPPTSKSAPSKRQRENPPKSVVRETTTLTRPVCSARLFEAPMKSPALPSPFASPILPHAHSSSNSMMTNIRNLDLPTTAALQDANQKFQQFLVDAAIASDRQKAIIKAETERNLSFPHSNQPRDFLDLFVNQYHDQYKRNQRGDDRNGETPPPLDLSVTRQRESPSDKTSPSSTNPSNFLSSQICNPQMACSLDMHDLDIGIAKEQRHNLKRKSRAHSSKVSSERLPPKDKESMGIVEAMNFLKPRFFEDSEGSPTESLTKLNGDGTAKSSGANRTSSGGSKSAYKSMSRARRVEANARERIRVHGISDAFERLRSMIPVSYSQQKLSKLAILKIASAYIRALGSALGRDYSLDKSNPSFQDCVLSVEETIREESKLRKRSPQRIQQEIERCGDKRRHTSSNSQEDSE